MLEVGREFGIVHTTSMCYPDDIPALRERFGERISFNGMISKKTARSRTTSPTGRWIASWNWALG